VCDCNPPEFFNSHIAKARKPHKCCECLRTIETGERHEVVAGKWDGDFCTFRTCPDCVELRHSLNLDCYEFGSLFEHVTHEAIAFNSTREQNLRAQQYATT
jgi:hypothetical protein